MFVRFSIPDSLVASFRRLKLLRFSWFCVVSTIFWRTSRKMANVRDSILCFASFLSSQPTEFRPDGSSKLEDEDREVAQKYWKFLALLSCRGPSYQIPAVEVVDAEGSVLKPMLDPIHRIIGHSQPKRFRYIMRNFDYLRRTGPIKDGHIYQTEKRPKEIYRYYAVWHPRLPNELLLETIETFLRGITESVARRRMNESEWECQFDERWDVDQELYIRTSELFRSTPFRVIRNPNHFMQEFFYNNDRLVCGPVERHRFGFPCAALRLREDLLSPSALKYLQISQHHVVPLP